MITHKFFLIRELEDGLESQVRASGSCIAFGVRPFRVFAQIGNHGLESTTIPQTIAVSQSPKEFG